MLNVVYTMRYTRFGEREHEFILDGKIYRTRSNSLNPEYTDDVNAIKSIVRDYGYDAKAEKVPGILWLVRFVGSDILCQDFWSLAKNISVAWRMHEIESTLKNIGNGMGDDLPTEIPEEDVIFTTEVSIEKCGNISVYQSLLFNDEEIVMKGQYDMQGDSKRLPIPDDILHSPEFKGCVFSYLLEIYHPKRKSISEALANILYPMASIPPLDGRPTFFPILFKALMDAESQIPRLKPTRLEDVSLGGGYIPS